MIFMLDSDIHIWSLRYHQLMLLSLNTELSEAAAAVVVVVVCLSLCF